MWLMLTCVAKWKTHKIHSLLAATSLIYVCVCACAHQSDHKSWPTSCYWLSWQCNHSRLEAVQSLTVRGQRSECLLRSGTDFQSGKWTGKPAMNTSPPFTFHPWIFTLLPLKCHNTRRPRLPILPEATGTSQSNGRNRIKWMSHKETTLGFHISYIS